MYLAKIEECFFKYRKQGTILSPQNWLIAERWEQMGIPLNIVCKGIRKTCRQFWSTHKAGEERIDALTYCEPEILRLWKDYRKALLGAPATSKDKSPESAEGKDQLWEIILKRLEVIRGSLSELEKGMDLYGDLKSRALSGLDWSKEMDLMEDKVSCGEGRVDIEWIETRLARLDDAYIQSLLKLLPEEQKDELKTEVEEELFPYKGQMDKKTYLKTVELGIESLVRERLKLQRISLYTT